MKQPFDIEKKVHEEAVNQLYRHNLNILIAESFLAVLFAIILWPGTEHSVLILWLSINITCNFISIFITIRYFHAKKNGKIPDINIWNSLFIFSLLLIGSSWGLASFLYVFSPNELYLLIIIMLLMLVIGSVNTGFFPSKIGYIIFVIPLYVSMISLSLIENTYMYNILLVGILAYIIFTNICARNYAIFFSKSLYLRFKNEDLTANLLKIKNELRVTNHELKIEVTARIKAEKILKQLASHDCLTGLANRHLLKIKLLRCIARSDRHQNSVALLYLDLDNFKSVNDSLGHDVGDQLLIRLGERLTSSLRKIDVIARIGGDEFCIVIDDIKDLTTVDVITKNLMNEFSSPFVINKYPLQISVSIGISIYPRDTADIDTLFKFADSALYIAKNSGRNNYKYFKEI